MTNINTQAETTQTTTTSVVIAIEGDQLIIVTGGGWLGDAASAVDSFVAGAAHGESLDTHHPGVYDKTPVDKWAAKSGQLVNKLTGPIGDVASFVTEAGEAFGGWVASKF